VKKRMEKFLVTQGRKRGELRGIVKEWHCGPGDALGEMWPDVEPSMGLLQNLDCLSNACSPVEARKLLAGVIQERSPVDGVSRWARGSLVRPIDVTRAIQRFKCQVEERIVEVKSRKARIVLGRELVRESSRSGLSPGTSKMILEAEEGRGRSRKQVMLEQNSGKQYPLRPCRRGESHTAGFLRSRAKPAGRER
jgi:hypothetical protein